jgi:arylsulfatase A-like enzyme
MKFSTWLWFGVLAPVITGSMPASAQQPKPNIILIVSDDTGYGDLGPYASVLKTGGYKTFFTGKWHLGEADYALPNAQGYDEMKYAGLYHLNAYTYADPTWFPDMDPELRAMFQRVTKGALSGNAGQPPHEDFKINGQYVDTPVINGGEGVVGIPFFDSYVERASLDYLDRNAQSREPFFMSINFMKVHQPNMPAPEFQLKSLSKSKYADSVVELDTRIGRIMDKVRALGLDKNTLVTRPTMGRGRMSTRTLATRPSAAPRAPCARAATAFPPSRGCRARSRPGSRTMTFLAAST